MNKETWDVVIVGGGISGWIAAAYAAKAGKRVLLAEKTDHFGGRARTMERKGVLLNLGAHALYKDGECLEMLKQLGATPEGEVPEPSGHMVQGGNIHKMPASPFSLLTTRMLSLRGKMELGQVMMMLKGIDTKSLPQGSLKDWADQTIREPEVRHLIYSLCRTSTYAHRPEIQSVGPVLRQIKYVLNGGALYVHGGWSTIIEKLRQVAGRAGVQSVTGKAAEQIVRETEKIQHLNENLYKIRFKDKDVVYTKAVILAIPPADCCKIVDGSELTALKRWHDQAQPVTVSCLDLGMRKLPNPKVQFVMGVDSPFLFTNQSRAAKLSNRGLLAVHLVKYHGSTMPNAKRDQADLERTMDLLQPGWRNEVLVKQYLPQITVVHDYDHTHRVEKPGPSVPELPGLYIAGDWVGHGELLADAAAASAKRAAEELISALNQEEIHEYSRAL